MPRGDADDAPPARLPSLPRQQLPEPHHAAAQPVIALAVVAAAAVPSAVVTAAVVVSAAASVPSAVVTVAAAAAAAVPSAVVTAAVVAAAALGVAEPLLVVAAGSHLGVEPVEECLAAVLPQHADAPLGCGLSPEALVGEAGEEPVEQSPLLHLRHQTTVGEIEKLDQLKDIFNCEFSVFGHSDYHGARVVLKTCGSANQSQDTGSVPKEPRRVSFVRVSVSKDGRPEKWFSNPSQKYVPNL